MKNNKSILIITRNLPPLVGGMERLNWHIADELSKIHQVSIVSHKEARKQAPKDAKFYIAPLSPLPLFLIVSFLKAFWICLIKRPNILFAGSGLTAPIAVILAKIFRIKSIVYIHGLDIATDNKLYNLFWIPCIRSANQIIANSIPTYQICINKKVDKNKLSIVHPGVSYPAKPQDIELIEELKNKYQLHDKKILISVGRLTERKGLNEFIDLSFSKIVKAIPNTILVIIGDTPSQSLNKNLQSKELILSTAKFHQVEHNIIFIGNINDDNILSSFYYLADIHVFPVKHIPKDPEGFGMVAIEAAAHSTPTIAFATGGIIDAVKSDVSGYLVELDNYEQLTAQIIELLENPEQIKPEKCKAFAEGFAWYNLANKLKNIIN
ncbi:glycosyltransferase family 4 protein [Acinetobacter qingfengensis]|uniref:Glycosyl transferase n=1 Tax=Acinetobacter qingfengensis TaxID=1262585 RepID=A0A1E7R179_9GAMM|nr:glycosyltransferase family 4 protein [Acinetobacter qingfengensis]KAA8733305.1 glycosyltransferase family 4 protein [Acinetobacter qingfengensis]OEY93063.1 glycosyl transferase [Acinetobacter qingfengensis]